MHLCANMHKYNKHLSDVLKSFTKLMVEVERLVYQKIRYVVEIKCTLDKLAKVDG